MFRKYVESRGLNKPRTFTAALGEFRQKSDDWFDGTPGSVDRRLAACTKLLHTAQTAAGQDPASQLQVIAELTADRTALKNLRDDLLSGAASRQPVRRVASTKTAALTRLSSTERRWVILESAKFHGEQTDARSDIAEMMERARHYAQARTGSATVIAAFEEAVADHARRTPRPKVAARKQVFTDFPDSQLFL